MKNKTTGTLLYLGIGAFLLYLAIHFWPAVASLAGRILSAALPLVIGAGLAYVFALPMDFYRRHYFPGSKKKWVEKTRLPMCMFFSVLSVLAVIALVIGLVLPQFISCIQTLMDLLPAGIKKTVEFLDRYHLASDEVINVLESIDWKSRVGSLLDAVGSGVGGVVSVLISTVTGVISGIITGFLSFIFALYILLNRGKLLKQASRIAKAYLPERMERKLSYFVSVLNDSFRKYIVGQCMESVILGVLCGIGMLILRLPYAAMIAALIAFTALIPIAGAYIGAVVGAFMILTVSPVKALIFLIFLIVLQQLEGNLIYPKVVGTSLGLPGIWVLAAVTIGGGIMGVGGMLLGVPLASAFYRIVKTDVEKKESLAVTIIAEKKPKPQQNEK